MAFVVEWYSVAAGRSPAWDFVDDLPAADAAAIVADINAVGLYDTKAPVSMKPIKGHRPMWEIRTRGFRTFYIFTGKRMIVLHACKKQDQERGIKVAAQRMKKVLEEGG